MNIVNAALSEDKEHRHPGVIGGLYGLGSLRPFARLTDGYPIVSFGVVFDFEANRTESDAAFSARLAQTATYFAGFDFRAAGFVLAGWAVSALMMHGDHARFYFSDFDLFLVGHTPITAKAAITNLGAYLRERWGPEMRVYRTQSTISFYARARTVVQVVLRLYATPAEVVHGFDLGSAAMMWDGHTVQMTRLGLVAANHGANILNLAVRRSSYEKRIARYGFRGFDLVLPDFDLETLAEQEVSGVETPPEAIPYFEINLPYIQLRRARLTGGPVIAIQDVLTKNSSSGGWYDGVTMQYNNGEARVVENARAARKGNIAGLCAAANYDAKFDIFRIDPVFVIERVESILRKLAENSTVNIRTAVAMLGEEGARTFITERIGRKPTPEEIRAGAEAVLAELQALNVRIPFEFKTVEDGTALVGSHAVTPETWYGRHYHKK